MSPVLLALLSGALLALSFPKFGHPAVAWGALVPLLVAIARPVAPGSPATLPRRGFVLGLVAGGVYFAGTLYWVARVMVTFGGLPEAAAWPVTALLVLYVATYPAIFGWLLGRALRARGTGALWLAPVLWTATEFLRGYLFTGFPWVALGYSQTTVLPVAQVASLGGVALLSLLVALVSTAVAFAIVQRGARGVRGLIVTAAIVGVAGGWGQWRLQRDDLTRAGTPLRVGIVQGNVPQDQKWDPAHADQILERYLDLTRRVAREGADFVLWPESATPFLFEWDPAGRQAVLDVAREARAWLLLGSDQVEPGTPNRYYNAAFLVSPQGTQAAVYRKMHLVPFGEYVPLRGLLFFAQPLVESVGDFGVGTEVKRLDIGHHAVTTAICYESIFPYLARQAVLDGSQLLTAITNDAWYGWSSAPFQHYEQGTLRAIEFGRYFVRAANTGISAIVDPYGRVVGRRGLFETATLTGEVRLLEGRTLYATIGDSPAWACVAVALLTWFVTRRARPQAASH